MLIQLAVLGLLVALLPLATVWASRDADKYRKLIWVTAFFTFDLIVFGAFTRLTDSGLGCPDWPGCYGQANPLQADADISAAEAAMPTGPVTVMKAWIEMIHRYIAMGIGVLIVALMLTSWRKWLQSGRRDAKFLPLFPTLLFAFVCLQGAFGAWTVTMKLQPVIVTIHLLLGMALLALLTWFGLRQSESQAASPAAATLRLSVTLASVLLAIQIALGGWVSTNYAVLVCMDVLLCQGSLWPPMDFANGFTLWRDLGMTGNGEYLPFTALTAIHWMHRAFSLAAAASIAWVALKSINIEGLRKTALWLLAGVTLQFATGVLTVFLNFPLVLAVIHNAGAAFLALLLVVLNYKIWTAGQETSIQERARLAASP